MGYSPGFLLKNGQISTIANSSEIDTNSCARSQNSFQECLGGCSESLERFPGLAKIGHVQNHGLQPRLFAQKRPNFDPFEFIRNRHKQFRKEFTNHFRRVQAAFQRVWSDFQDLPKSAMFKTMGYSPGFLLKNGQISTLSNSSEIDTNSSARSLQIILGGFRRRFREFGAISRICQNRPCSKPWAIAQPFCAKTAKFRPFRIHPKSTQTVAQGVRNHFRRVQAAFERVWSDFQDLPKQAVFKTMGYSPGFLFKNGQISTLSNSSEIDTNSCARSQKSFQEGLGGVSESLERFPGLAKIGRVQNHGLQPRLFAQNRPIFDPCEFNGNRNKQSRKELKIILGGFRWRFREFGAISRTCKNPPCSNHGLQPRLFAQKRPNLDPCEFIRNRHKQLRKELEIILGGFRWLFREFGAISRTCQNRPCSKPWAIVQAFYSKTAKFRPFRIQTKSTQTVAQGVRNHFKRVQEAFQRVWSDIQDLPKSAMFKTMGYSPGFLLKIGQFSTLANSAEIETNSRARS